MSISTEIRFGNKDITISLAGERLWEKEGLARRYFEVESYKARPITKFYEVLSGGTRDRTVIVNGRTFGYVYGFCGSNSKQSAADNAARQLAEQVAA